MAAGRGADFNDGTGFNDGEGARRAAERARTGPAEGEAGGGERGGRAHHHHLYDDPDTHEAGEGAGLFAWLDSHPIVFGPALSERARRALRGGGGGDGGMQVHKSPLGTLSAVRQELLRHDPSLNQSLISSGTSISQLYDQNKWERHRHIGRYGYNLSRILGSTVFQRVLRPVMCLTAHAALVVATGTHAGAVIFPVQLLGTAVGLLVRSEARPGAATARSRSRLRPRACAPARARERGTGLRASALVLTRPCACPPVSPSLPPPPPW